MRLVPFAAALSKPCVPKNASLPVSSDQPAFVSALPSYGLLSLTVLILISRGSIVITALPYTGR